MNESKLGCCSTAFPAACCTLELAPEAEEQFVRMARAIGNPVRFQIVKYLTTHPGCITGDIVQVLPIAQATTSQHLKVLREAGWITGTVSGTATCYCLSNENAQRFKEIVASL